MSLFDRLVDAALAGQAELAPLRPVVEKELLHHDILREMSHAGLLTELTFIGGTCLRACYGSNRLSEDLDFAGGEGFRRDGLSDLARCLVEGLRAKYDLPVEVGEPVREAGNVDTWRLRVVTRPERRDLPAQRINIDICAIASHERRPALLRNRYGVEMGTSGLIVQAQSREEILADKLVALALRPNRIKNRDVWDIGWLVQQGVALPLDLIPKKIADHRRRDDEFLELLDDRMGALRGDPALRRDFVAEMRRFLLPSIAADTVENPDFWMWLVDTVTAECARIRRALAGNTPRFGM